MSLWLRLARLLPGLLLGVCLALLLALCEGLRLANPAQRRARWTQCFLSALARRLPYEYRVFGQLPTKPMLWVSNHVSWADVLVLGQLAPLTFLAKADVRQWPLLGWLAERAGTLFIRRGGGESAPLRLGMAEHLRQGGSVLVFPEGTTTDGSGTATFHARLLGAAIEAGVAVQPVALKYLRGGQLDPIAPFIGEDALWPHLKRLFRHPRAVVEVHLLPPLPCQGQDRSNLVRLARLAIEQRLAPQPDDTRQVA
ncbi:lysophospholipid acyltransferase family protein [Pseudomonas sp. DC3000-4b1]|uniref:lysophospholipid acyltransferase family protein n=1 Tax=unclassified Pseudomonas TaxID=196821 RepID=UPI003CED79D9